MGEVPESEERARVEKPKEIFDRDTEWRELQAAWETARPELILVLGRRRAGKSFLLSRFAHQVQGIYYQATRRTGQEQLARLCRVVGESLGDAALARGADLPDWEALVDYLADRADRAPLLLVLDEFPYLVAAEPALPSIVQALWDGRWQSAPFKLVLCGSLVTAMHQLERHDQPLYGRRTARIEVAPFSYLHVSRFLPAHSPRNQFLAYGIFGGLPGHLDLIDPELPLAENVARTVLAPSGRLSDEAQHMLDVFVDNAEVHYSIIEAIAERERTWRGITRRVGRSGGSLLRPLEWLQAMGLVERVVPITEKQPHKSKKVLYRISDPYVSFWHRFVSPLVAAGSLGLVDGPTLWRDYVRPRLNDHMGDVFEQICREFVRHTPALPFTPLRIGQWWSPDGSHELDVVALGGEGEVLAGECKWGSVTARDLSTLRERARMLVGQLPGTHRVHLALFSGEAPADEEVAAAVAAGEVLYFGPGELLCGG